MKSKIRIAMCVGLAGIAMFAVSCGDDNPVAPAAVDRSETKLGTYTSSFTATSGVEPSQPYVAAIVFGVWDELATLDPPDVVLFDNRTFADGEKFTADKFNTGGFSEIADRLTDNIDRIVYVSAEAGPTFQTEYNVESLIFQNLPSTRPGPDLAGFTITGIHVTVDLNVTENAGTWTTALTFFITILGH